MAYGRNGGGGNGGRSAPAQEKNHPVFTREIFTPGGTIRLAVWEKTVQGEKKTHTNFFVSVSRSYKKKDSNEYETTDLMNPGDLLICSDLFRIAWEFVLEECNKGQ